TSAFRFNDAVLRNMVISQKEAKTESSPLMKKPEEKRERDDTRDESAPREETVATEPVAEEGQVATEPVAEAGQAAAEAVAEETPANPE
ncbi:MAG: 30S ribosomal protein S6, partial [Halobacteria archaeon]|nr:30S ribosomal protein S6 [Halobacteria archaeon]